MKTKWLFTIGIGLLMNTCKQTSQPKAVYTIFIDRTAPELIKPDAEALIDYLEVATTDRQLLIRIRELTSVDDAPVQQLYFKPERGLLANQVEQKRQLRNFKRKLTLLLEQQDSLSSRPYSNIFDPVCEELSFYKQLEDYQHKQILIFSDLKENNSEWMSFYHPSIQRQLLQRSPTLRTAFINRLPELDSLSVYIQVVHIPKHQRDNIEYRAIKELYRGIFSQTQGVRIDFSANLTKAPRKP